MHVGRTVFSQLMDLFPLAEFRNSVERYRGNHKVQRFSCLDQLLCLAFAQITARESLRDIGQILIRQARQLYSQQDLGLEFSEAVYALDSTTIDLCLSLFPWTPFRYTKAAIKVHTALDLRGSIPSFIQVTPPLVGDASMLDQLSIEPGACYVMDRGYIHFLRLYRLTQAGAFFVIRAKDKMHYRRRYSHRVDKTTGLRSDQTIVLTGRDSKHDYPAPARLIRYWDQQHNLRLRFLTNNFLLPALTIAQLYKRRWDVELFFKWIKQHLRIKRFYGNSPNAVKTQIWVAVIVYLLVAILKKQLGIEASLYRILQVLSVTVFEKTPILQVLQPLDSHSSTAAPANQLNLFDF